MKGGLGKKAREYICDVKFFTKKSWGICQILKLKGDIFDTPLDDLWSKSLTYDN